MKQIFTISAILLVQFACSQNGDTSINKTLLKELALSACNCVDSIRVLDKEKTQVSEEIHLCIDKQTSAYQMGSKILNVGDLLGSASEDSEGNKQINISVNMDKNSDEYKQYYYEMERYLMGNCEVVKQKIASRDKLSSKSISPKKEARDYYSKGLDASKAGDCEKAIEFYKKALKVDSEFAFAWDNIGLCYRKLEKYDKAIQAYQKSRDIDPTGMMPLQNIAIVYQYKQQYKKAIDAYEKLALLDKNNPEVFYGTGNIYASFLGDFEKGLINLCKAYNLYIEQKSPYRTDAEKLINFIFLEMKKQGKEERFNEILKENNIRMN